MRLILIQGNRIATYIGRQQVAVISVSESPTQEVIAEVFNSKDFWTAQTGT